MKIYTKTTKKLMMVMSLFIIAAFALTSCGGGGGFSPEKNISVTAREDGSGTKTAFMELVGLKDKADPDNVVIQTGTAAILTEVKGNPVAIGYESLGYVTDEVKLLSVDGVAATNENIKNGTYGISRPLSVVYKEETVAQGVNKAFLDFLKSSDAQEIIAENNYVSIADNAQVYTIDGTLTGSIDISGSTSVQPLMIELANAFTDLQPNVEVTVSGGGSGTGYKNAENGTSEMGMISAEFDQGKAEGCTYYTIAKDGIGIIVNPLNPLNNITLDQLKNIYDVDAGNNAITTWAQIIG